MSYLEYINVGNASTLGRLPLNCLLLHKTSQERKGNTARYAVNALAALDQRIRRMDTMELRLVNICVRRGGRSRWVTVFALTIGNIATFTVNGKVVIAWS